MKYRGYEAAIKTGSVGGQVYGRLLGVPDAIIFHADNMDGIEAAFHEAVDEYISAIHHAAEFDEPKQR